MKKRIVVLIMAILLLALVPTVLADSGDEWLVSDCQCENPDCDTTTGTWIQNPTCVKRGIKVVKCRKCGKDRTYTMASDPDAHVFPNTNKWDCKEGIKCKYYGQKDSEGHVCNGIKAGTKFADHDWKPATCMTPKKCKRDNCGLEVGERKQVHDESDYEPATCTEPKKCKTCGFTPTGAKPLGHNMQFSQTIQTGTCTKDEKKLYKCSRCPHTETRTKTAPGHKFGSWVTKRQACDPAGGYQERVCSVCGKTEKQNLAKKEHSFYAWHTTKAATCTATGTKERNCTVCGYVEKGTLPVLGHKFGNWTTKRPACHPSGGYQERTCSRCNKVEKQNLAKTNHSFYAWHTTKSATCTAAGTKERNCTVCGYVESGTIAKLGHNMGSWTTTKNATCTAAGTQERKCTRSGCTYKETKSISAYGHSYNAAGKCIRCGKQGPIHTVK